MTWNCDEFTEADRARAEAENLSMCGVNEPEAGDSARGINTNNCGTSTIYVGQSGGKANVSYALFSSQGIITSRGLDIAWGPTYAGGKYDFGAWGSDTFNGSATNIGYAMNNKPFGATMGGWVTLLGWTLSCTVYVSEPVHNL